MKYQDYEVPGDLQFDVISLTRMRKLSLTIKLDKKYYENIFSAPNKILSATVKLNITVNQKDIFVNGSVYGERELQCGRCLDVFKTEYSSDFEEIYSTGAQIIDIMSLVNGALVLTEDIRFLCGEECKGICDVCGQNKNAGDCKCEKEVFSPFAVLKEKKNLKK